ncbi:MAG: hypothetical protein AABY15_08585 [Nanoarchaeota archaeon]
MKYIITRFNRNWLWLIALLLFLGFVTLAIVDSVENGVGMARKFRDTHKIVIPVEQEGL